MVEIERQAAVTRRHGNPAKFSVLNRAEAHEVESVFGGALEVG